jgi:hypothetical protein
MMSSSSVFIVCLFVCLFVCCLLLVVCHLSWIELLPLPLYSRGEGWGEGFGMDSLTLTLSQRAVSCTHH